MRYLIISCVLLLTALVIAACQQPQPTPPPTTTPPTAVPPTPKLGAGFRFSTYGPPYNPGPDYWARVGQEMAANFPQAQPAALWIVGQIYGDGVFLTFPCDTEAESIRCTAVDQNEATLDLFDQLGYQVWLQVEPGHADVTELIHLMLNQYSHHPSVAGVGVDVEWYQSTDAPEGKAVTDAEAAAWLAAAREHGEYDLFLKHWLPEKMPPTLRDGLLFVDDSQMFESLEQMVAEFAAWQQALAPGAVGYQFGYPADRHWWGELDNPPQAIGEAILTAVPDTAGLYWVDFTVLDLFPVDTTDQ